MPIRDARIRAYFLDRLFVAHDRGERLVRAGLAGLLGDVAATPLGDRLLFERRWLLDPEAPALRPEGEAAAGEVAGASPRAEELWTGAAPLLGSAARVAAGRGELPDSSGELLGRSILLRDYAGHGRRQLVLFPFAPGAEVPSVVVKVTRAAARSGDPETGRAHSGGDGPAEAGGDGGSTLRAEAEALNRLAAELPPGLVDTVPAPVAYESRDGEEALVVAHLEGRPVYLELQNRLLPGPGASRRHLRDAADWLSAFHRATRRSGRRMTVTAGDRAHAAGLAGAGHGGGDPAWLDELAAVLEARPVSLAASHGDFWPRNLLRRVSRGFDDEAPAGDARRTVPAVPGVGVVDWEHFAHAAPPTEDLFHFAIAYGSCVRWRGAGRVGLEEAFRRILFAEHRIARAVGDYLERYAARAELPFSLLAPLLRLHVLRRHRAAADPDERAGWAACWRRLVVERSPVLERLG